MATTKKAIARVLQLKITLIDSRPSIWRRVLVPGDFKLPRLHRVIQIAMGWNDSHLHMFTIEGNDYGRPDGEMDFLPILNEVPVRLDRVLHAPPQSFTYGYDFGDSWEHKIVLEKVLDPDPAQVAPCCLAGKGACPPDDVGGPGGYYQFVKAITNPRHEDHQEMMEWIGGGFDPAAFDVDLVNQLLKQRGALA